MEGIKRRRVVKCIQMDQLEKKTNEMSALQNILQLNGLYLLEFLKCGYHFRVEHKFIRFCCPPHRFSCHKLSSSNKKPKPLKNCSNVD